MTRTSSTTQRSEALRDCAAAATIRGLGLMSFVWWVMCLDVFAAAPPEYKVKAQLLVNFAACATWPGKTFQDTNAPVIVGIVGKDPFEGFLDAAVEANSRARRPGRALVIRKVIAESEMRECHILFFASSERRRWRDVRQRLKGEPILTVGEMDDFLEDGGVINFMLKGQLVRFDISVDSAKAARLTLDARLLSVADTVVGKYD